VGSRVCERVLTGVYIRQVTGRSTIQSSSADTCTLTHATSLNIHDPRQPVYQLVGYVVRSYADPHSDGSMGGDAPPRKWASPRTPFAPASTIFWTRQWVHTTTNTNPEAGRYIWQLHVTAPELLNRNI